MFRRGCDEFGEATVRIDADNFQVLADMRLAHVAGATMAAIHVHFGADEIAGLDGSHLRADFFDDAAKFVAESHRWTNSRSGPGIPAVDVQVSAADGRGAHADQNFDWARHGNGNGFELRAAFGAHLAKSFHGGLAWCTGGSAAARQICKVSIGLEGRKIGARLRFFRYNRGG